METFSVLLFLAGLIGLVVGIVLLIVAVVKKKPKKSSAITLVTSFAVAMIGFFLVPTTASETTSAEAPSTGATVETVETTEESEAFESTDFTISSSEMKEIEEEREKEEQENMDPSTYSSDITYDNLARNPDDYVGEKVILSGRIVQVMENDDAEYTQYRLAVNDDYDTVALIEIPKDQLESRLLEDDIITAYGFSAGVITYESTMSGEITIPAVAVNMFEMN